MISGLPITYVCFLKNSYSLTSCYQGSNMVYSGSWVERDYKHVCFAARSHSYAKTNASEKTPKRVWKKVDTLIVSKTRYTASSYVQNLNDQQFLKQEVSEVETPIRPWNTPSTMPLFKSLTLTIMLSVTNIIINNLSSNNCWASSCFIPFCVFFCVPLLVPLLGTLAKH